MDFTSERVGMVRENHMGRQDFRERGMGHEHRQLRVVNLDNLRSHSHLRTLTVMVMVMRIGHGFLSCCRATFRNKLIDKWQRKTEVTTGAADIKSELHAFNQNISEQVASYIKDPSRMVGQMQMWKLAVAVFGTVTQSAAGAEVDGDPELLDDFELYQTTHHLLVKLLGHLILHT
ncbi:hypothetical protein DVH24_013710 [Malus domestica]|uniref:Uncharacterized protein n=1 Tax=Malus domestica TaxID=3750 RepID=A0A498JGG7_MALDO|nr:hypothetical protein DVH24_013710 [Malus domestica]